MGSALMTRGNRRALIVLGSIVTPIVLFIGLMIVHEQLQPQSPGPGPMTLPLGLWSLAGSLCVGFLLLVREFRLYAFVLGAIYFPAMWYVLTYVAYRVALSYGYS